MKSKIIFLPVLLSVWLAGCASWQQPAAPVRSGRGTVTSSSTQDASTKILAEANRLAERVRRNELSRLEAADQLNIMRLRLVGANMVDDSTFSTYRLLVLRREEGVISQEESQSRMEMKLREWQRRWPRLARRPANPAFTNFLMQLYGMPLLK